MGEVIAMPGIDPATVRPLPTSIADLPPGARALVVTLEGSSFVVDVYPAFSGKNAGSRAVFPSLKPALQFARRSRACFPKMFQLVLNETGRQTSGELLGSDPDPMGLRLRR
jgi:hypothetical protein